MRRRMFRWLAILSMAAVVGLDTGCSTRTRSRGVVVIEAPPAPRVERRSRAPGKNYVWAQGHWGWSRGRHVWVPGHWIKAKKNHTWVDGYWDKRGGEWVYVKGYWDPPGKAKGKSKGKDTDKGKGKSHGKGNKI
jgi:hypothetical protein